MKMTKMTVEYQVTRSRDYQSVRLGGAVEIEIGPDEDKKECFTRTRQWLANQVNAAAEEELENVLREAR